MADRVFRNTQKANLLTNTKALDIINPNARVNRDTAKRVDQERREARQKQIG